MRLALKHILVFLLMIPLGLSGQNHVAVPVTDAPAIVPTLTGPGSACESSTENFYSTDPGQTFYTWQIPFGGLITSGDGTHTIKVTWLTGFPPDRTLSVSYTGSTVATMNVVVLPSLTVSVSISASANPVCAGIPVLYTAVPSNGGTTPLFQWQVNGMNIAGATNATYTFTPANNNTVACLLTSGEICTTGNQVLSNVITMTVNPLLPVSISIAASTNPSCAGASVNYTATAFNGGTSPACQWKVNGTNAPGATNFSYAYVPADHDKVTCVLTSNATCVSANPAISNEINMTVSPNLPVSVSITASEYTTCPDHLVYFTATPVNGGSSPVYNWFVNGTSTGTNNPVYSYTPGPGDLVKCIMTSGAGCTIGNPATSNEITMTVSLYSPVSITISASANPVCNGVQVVFTANPVNGGSSPVYQWSVNGTPVGATNAIYTYTPTNGDIVSCQVVSNALCTTGNPAVSNAINMTVSSSGAPAVAIVSSANPVCQGTVVTFTATPDNGGISPFFQWKVNGIAAGTNSTVFAYVPVNGETVTCLMTSNSLCSSGIPVLSNAIAMSVSPIQVVGVSITTPSIVVCQGSSVTYTAVAVNGGTTPAYQWQVNGGDVGTNSAVFAYQPVNNDVVTCILTSNASCSTGNPATSNPVSMSVSTSLPAGVTIVASSSPACTGVPVIFTATTVNGGSNPVYEWRVNNISIPGATNTTFSYASNNDYNVTCILTSNNGCPLVNTATSNLIAMTVVPLVSATVTVSASANPSCLGAFITFTATPVNGGAMPHYQWIVNGLNVGTDLPTYTYSPTTGDAVKCLLTSNEACMANGAVSSNTITMTVDPILTATIFVTTPDPLVCPGTQVAFTAHPTNPGTTPAYQWYLNGTPCGNNNPVLNLIPNDGDRISCRLTSSWPCLTGNPVTSAEYIIHTNSPLPGSITINASQNPFCQGTMVSFTSSIVNGGPTPGYQWSVNGTVVGILPSYSYVPANGDFVTCRLNSSLSCSTGPVTSNPILMLLKTVVPASVNISGSANPVCVGGAVTFTAIPVNGGLSPGYQWKVNGIDFGTNSPLYTYVPVNGDVVTCTMTSNAGCVSGSPATSNPVTMIVSPALPASVSITTNTNPFCLGKSVKFIAHPANGGSAPSYQWQLNGGNLGLPSASPVLDYSPANGNVISCLLTSNSTCITGSNPVQSNQITMTESASLPVSITIAASANPACQGSPVTFTAAAVNGGGTPAYQWKSGGINVPGATGLTYTYVPANGNVITCVLTSDLTCGTGSPAVSNQVVMVITPNPVPVVTITPSANPACEGTAVTFTTSLSNGGLSPGFTWRVNGQVVTGATNSTYTYQPANFDAVTCQLLSDALCNTGTPVVSNQVAMVINAAKNVGVTITTPSLSFCLGTPVTFTANPINGGTAPAYQWKVNGISMPGATNASYTYQPANGDLVTCVMTSNQSCIVAGTNPATSNSLLMTSGSLVPSITISVDHNQICPNTSVVFSAVAMNGGSPPIYHWTKNGATVGYNQSTYEVSPANGDLIACELTSRLSCILGATAMSNTIAMIVYPAEPLSVVVTASANPSCQGGTVCYFAAVENGGSFARYNWKVNGVVTISQLNNPTYCYIPANNDSISCGVFSSATCPVPNPRNSNRISMVVLPISTPSVSVSAPGNLVCAGTPVLFTAIPSNGGPSPAYQWKVNLLNVDGATNANYTYIPANSDVVNNEMTSNANCISTNVALSPPYPISLSPNLPVSVSIVATTSPICQGLPATFVATPLHGGSIPVYQWMVNLANAGTNSPTFTYMPANGDVVSCRLTSNEACASGNPAVSNSITVSVIPAVAVSVLISASSTPACQGQSITYTAIAVGGGVNPYYQWLVNGMIVGTNSPSYTYVPSSGDAVACHVTSDISCATGNPAISNVISMIFPPYVPVSVSVTCSANPACQGIPATFVATPVNGGTTPAYQWKNKGFNITGATNPTYSYLPLTNDVITCELVSSETCVNNNPATSNSITMSVLQLTTPSISVVPSVNPICDGNEVTFTANPLNGGASPVYHWFKNNVDQGPGLATYTYFPVNGDEIYCQLTTSLACVSMNIAVSNTVIMDVESEITPTITIAAAPFPSCDNQPVTFTATPQNSGANPVYQWVVNGFSVGVNSPVYTYIPTAGDKISCELATGYTCATAGTVYSNEIIMEVNPVLTVSISITPSDNPVCTGTLVTYTATAVNGGSSATYQWQVNGLPVAGATNTTWSYVPNNNDVITCKLVSSEPCVISSEVISNGIPMMVAASFSVAVTIATLDNPSCVNTMVIFTATPSNGGNTPSYKWFVNAIEQVGATNATFSFFPVHGDFVQCVMTSQFSCGAPNPATSNGITMQVLGTPVAVTITAVPAGAVCAGTPVTYTSHPVNGGTVPTYQWNVNGSPVAGTNNPVFIYAPLNLEEITCTLNSNATCVVGNTITSLPITAAVNPNLPVSVQITANPGNTICAGTPVIYTATPFNGGITPGFQWKLNGVAVNGATNATWSYSPVNNEVISCELTSNAICPAGNPAISNLLTMTVNPLLPVSVSIVVSANPVCTGTLVNFTTTVVNGGLSAAYQWKVNGVPVNGATNTTWAYIPLNNEVITCELTSSVVCPAGSPAISNPVTMTVNPMLPVSVSVTASANPVCAGTIVTFTATPVNGGLSATYQWKVGGVSVNGATNATWSYLPGNNEVITCELTSNAICATGSPAISNPITMTVNPMVPVSVSAGASANPVCAGTTVIFTATPVNGGLSPAYQWKVGGVSMNGATNSTWSYIPADNEVVTCQLTSSAVCPTGNPASSNPVTMTVNPLLPVSVSAVASANPVCAGTSVTFTATPFNGGLSAAYQWKVGGISVNGATNVSWTYIPNNNEVITCELTSSVVCPAGNPAISNPVTMTVNPLLPVSVSAVASANPVCAGTTITFTATPVNGGLTAAYQWKVGGASVNGATNATWSYIPANNEVVTCELISNAICATSNPAISNAVNMTVNPLLLVSVSAVASANPVCAGTTVTFTATPVNGGLSATYQWKVGGISVNGATNSTWPYSPNNNEVITCELTSNAICATSNPATSNSVTMTVNPLLPVSVSAVASANPVCAGTAVTFTATPVNGGVSAAYQWKVGGVSVNGATNATWSYMPNNNEVITCELASGAVCATGSPAISNAVTMTVNPLLPVSITIGASANPVCAGTSVTFTATPVNGGLSAAYQWKVGGASVNGATNATWSYIPNNNEVITCELTSNAICTTGNPAISNPVTMTVNPLLPVSVSAVASANPVCSGTLVTFTATPVNGGVSAAYQWKVGGVSVNGATNSSWLYVPNNNEVVTCELTSDALCTTGNPAISNPVTMTVNLLLPVSVSVVASTNPVCAGTTVAFTATTVNGGLSAEYQWKIGGVSMNGATNATWSYTPNNNEVITCEVTSTVICATGSPAISNPVTMTVNPLLPVSVSAVASANPVCAGTTVTFTATPVNGGLSAAYQWKVGGIPVNGATNSTWSYSPNNNEVITCELVSDAICATGNPATSNAVTMTVNPLLPVSVSAVASANPLCAGTSVTFTATPVNGGLAAAYQWKIGGVSMNGATNFTWSYTPNNNEVITCELTSGAFCTTGNPAISNAINMTVNPLLPVSVSIVASANPVCAGTTVSFTATPVNGGVLAAYQWKIGGSSVNGATNATWSYIPNNNEVITCELASGATCATGNPAISDPVTMTVNPLLPVSLTIGASANPVCAGTTVTFTATPVNGGLLPAYQWEVGGAPVNGATNSTWSYSPGNNEVITCELASGAICTTGNPAISNPITMTVNPLLPVSVTVGASANPICAGTSVTFTSTPVNGGLSATYQWKVGVVSVNGATNATWSYMPNNNEVITCELASGAVCATGSPAISNAVTMTVNPLLPVSVSVVASANPVCAGTTVTYTATPVNGGLLPVYQWTIGGVPVNGATNSTWSYSPNNNDIITCELTSGAVCATGNPAISNPVTMTVNPLLPVSISVVASANPVCAGTTVTFTATPVNGGLSAAYQWKSGGVSVIGATNATWSYIPVNNEVITCELASGLACPTGSPATSIPVTMTVNPLIPVSVTVGASANPVCAGTPVTYTATLLNGGTAPALQWRVNGTAVAGATNAAYTYIPVVNDAITCDLTSNVLCPSAVPAISIPYMPGVNPIPVVTYTACHDIQTTIYARPFKLHGGLPLGGTYSGNGVNPSTGVFDPAAAGPGIQTITYTYTTAGFCTSSNSLAINNQNATPANCLGTTITDIRDNQVYPIVKIGTQCWLAGNLNYGTRKNSTDPQADNCVNDKYCLYNSDLNCGLYGGFYQWDELMRYDPGVVSRQGLCPPGWHVPTETEWLTLFNFYGGQSIAGTPLMQGTGSFNAVPGGVLYQNQQLWSFDPPGFAATFFWTSQPVGQWQAKAHGLNNEVISVSDYFSGRENGLSARCLQD